MSDIFSGVTGGGVISGIGGIFGAVGDFAEASAYGTAAKYAGQNATIAGEEGKIKLLQTQRKISQTLGAQSAQYAGAGLKMSGSAVDVHANSMQQGALEKGIVQEQTQINVSGYLEQEAQFKGMQTAANAAGVGGIIGGIASIFGL